MQTTPLHLAVLRICSLVYGGSTPAAETSIGSIADGMEGLQGELLNEAIEVLHQSKLLRRRGDNLHLNPTGKKAFGEDCVLELVFGDEFVIAKYGPSVVHVIVRTPTGDERGGSGFIIAQPVNGIATAKHVLEGNQLLRIETRDGTELPILPGEIIMGPEGIDLAIIRAEIPNGATPLPIELRDRGVIDLEPVLVLGYPPIAGHEPALIPVNAQATGGVRLFGGVRHSLVLQRMTTPGFSGGPILDKRGKVIGVIREEGGVQGDHGHVVFILGTPTQYFSDL